MKKFTNWAKVLILSIIAGPQLFVYGITQNCHLSQCTIFNTSLIIYGIILTIMIIPATLNVNDDSWYTKKHQRSLNDIKADNEKLTYINEILVEKTKD